MPAVRILVSLIVVVMPMSLAAQAPGSTRYGIPRRPAYADSLPNPMAAPIPRSIGEAEAEGARWPRRPEATTQRGAAAQEWAMDAPRRCATAEVGASLRSGEFKIGGELVSGPRPGGQVKIWWKPMHAADSVPLVVRGVSLSNPADTLRQLFKELALGEGPGGGATGEMFFPSGFWFPASGRFLVVATSGADWGCFILSH